MKEHEPDHVEAQVVSLKPGNPFLNQLQEELMEVIDQEKFGKLSVAETVGVLEFIKFNIINDS